MIAVVVVVGIVVVWYLAEYVFDEAFDAVWASVARLFGRQKSRGGRSSGEGGGSSGLMMTRPEDVSEDDATQRDD